jgi:hypothetical protein
MRTRGASHRWWAALAACSSALAAACSAAPPAPAKNDEAIKVVGTAEPAGGGVVTGDVDVSPVPAPGEVVMHLRWKSPATTASTAAALAGLAPSDVHERLRAVVRELVREELGDKVDPELFHDNVHLEAPIDAVLIADTSKGGQVPDLVYALSLGLTSLERALGASRGKPQELARGVWQIGTEDQWGTPCAVAAAAGEAPARLVCADSATALQRVAAFTARNIATLPEPKSDVRLQLELRGVLDKYGRQWANQARGLPVLIEEFKRNVPKFDTALIDVADALAAEAAALTEDLDSIAVDIGLDPNQGAELAFELELAGSRSWLAKTLIDGADRAGPAPAITWRLPASAEFVGWGISGDPQRLDPLLKTGRDMLEGFLEAEQFGAVADREAIAKLLRRVQKGSYVATTMASGHFPPSTAAAGTQKTIADLAGDVVGWYLLGFDEPPAEVTKWLDEGIKVYNRAAVQQWLKAEMGSSARHLPVLKKVTAPAGLGGGAMAVEITVPQIEDPLANQSNPPNGGAPQLVDVKATVLVMGDGNRTWLGLALDGKSLAQLMQGLKGTGGTTLASRPGLDRMKTESHAGGALTSIDGVVGMVTPIIHAIMSVPGVGVGGIGQQVLSMLQQMPNQGKTPIVMFADRVAGSAPKVRWSLSVPKGSIEDIGFLVRGAASLIP